MSLATTIVAALAAGAAAATEDVVADAVKSSYQALKNLLKTRYNVAAVDLIESDPSSSAFEKAAAEEVHIKISEADPEVSKATADLLNAIENDPPAQQAVERRGIRLGDIDAKKSILMRNVIAPGGIETGNITTEEGFTFENINTDDRAGNS